MDKNELRDSLDHFHKELENSSSLGAGDRKRLERMEADMRQMLEAEQAKRDDSIIEQLDRDIHQFEVSHPELTIAIGHLLDILSQEGI
jgi:predicted  nucleic acid-binding Zn-ribbon protein